MVPNRTLEGKMAKTPSKNGMTEVLFLWIRGVITSNGISTMGLLRVTKVYDIKGFINNPNFSKHVTRGLTFKNRTEDEFIKRHNTRIKELSELLL